ncbi:excalibur calcium-binding domain-containing protein [Phyllobacterium zundukense]|nr:excalibur calcium-binding domain-containing protein [Phyllobacterium zundukense]
MWSDGEKYSRVVEFNGVKYRRLRRSRRLAKWSPYFLSSLSWKLTILAALGLLVHAVIYPSPSRDAITVRHFLAEPNCRAARSVGLAEARRGQPGYWPHLDRDNDGIACERYPR